MGTTRGSRLEPKLTGPIRIQSSIGTVGFPWAPTMLLALLLLYKATASSQAGHFVGCGPATEVARAMPPDAERAMGIEPTLISLEG